jgi:hypothetical protein
LSFLPLDWVRYRNLPQLFYGWSLFWPHHKILKRNPGPNSLLDGAHGVSAKKIMVSLSLASRILASWISQSFICHTYIIIAPECMLLWLFFFSHCCTNVTQSSQSTAEILKMCKYLGSNFLGAIPPFTNEEIELWSKTIWDSGPRLQIILEFWPKDWSTFGLGLEPFSSTVEGLCIWNLWTS